jgi:hypothetical protein
MKYLYEAQFQDGSKFKQPADDASKLNPTKSSKYDFLEHAKGRRLVRMALSGEGREVVALSGGWFTVDGVLTAPGSKLPDGCDWIEGDVHQGPYFRRVTRHYNADFEEVGSIIQFCVGLEPKPGVRNFVGVV